MSWLELGNDLTVSLSVRFDGLRDPKSELLDSFGKCVDHLLLHRLSGNSSHGYYPGVRKIGTSERGCIGNGVGQNVDAM